jgi:hypothetical protein
MHASSMDDNGTLPFSTQQRYRPGEWICPDCSSRYRGFTEPYAPHMRACPKRGYKVTLRNLARMYWLHITGHGCAKYIRAHELMHLRSLLRAR